MHRPLLPAVLLAAVLSASPARAEDRSVGIGSFDRIRVDGPIIVSVATGSPRAIVSGDRATIAAVDLRVDGSTLTVRIGNGVWGERAAAGGARGGPVSVALSTPALASATVIAGAKLSVAAMKAQRVVVSLSGAGAVDVGRIDAEDVAVTLVGTGTVTLAGKAQRARLLANGSGTIEAGSLEADDAYVALEGVGTIDARARYTAQVASSGLGSVTVAGNPKCRLPTRIAGPIRCGD